VARPQCSAGQTARRLATDVVLAVVVTAVISVAIATSSQPSARPIWVAYAFAVAFGVVLFARHAMPVAVVAVTCLGLVAYYATGLPSIGLAVPVAAALYAGAEAGVWWASTIAALGLLAYTYGYRISIGDNPAYLLGYELASNVAIMAAAIALGDGRRSRQRLLAEQAEVIRRREAERAAEAQRIVADERLRIARDLHDSVGHSVVALSLHADAGAEALAAGEGEAARRELVRVREAAAGAMRDLRRSVGGLRARAADDELRRLLAPLSEAGIEVTVCAIREGQPTDAQLIAAHLSDEAAEVMVSVVREASTNIVRHARSTAVYLGLAIDDGRLIVEVNDNGASAEDSVVFGHGLTGMRERVELGGGRLDVRPGPSGFRVRAELPIRGART
jgi:signal transduction histidine kinase